MEYLRLIGIVVVLVGFALRLRVAAVVVAAGLVTGLVAHMPLFGTDAAPGVVDTLGKAFVSQRIITLFVLALPAIGLSERYGLQEQARRLIHRIRAATVGRLQFVFQLFRFGVGALGVRLGSGHVAFSRPLVLPMALGAAGLEQDANDDRAERIKGATGASENYGNFFGQNLFVGAPGVALVVTALKDAGIATDPLRVVFWVLPVVVMSGVAGAVQFLLLDRWLRRTAPHDESPAGDDEGAA